MNSFQRIKKINGKEYAYEITPYYDSKTKKIRHRSRYLGKFRGGKIVRPMKPLPKTVFSHGEFLPLNKAYEELDLHGILTSICKDKDANTIRLLVCNRLTRPLALQNIGSWAEGTTLWRGFPCATSSQTLSSFLAHLGTSSIPETFIRKFISSRKGADSVAIDITSLSSYSELNNLLEYGYSRDNDGLPQFNLSLAVDRRHGIPLMYDIYPGSINDVSTIHNSIRKMKSFGLSVSVLVLDRGFFSTTNIDELLHHQIPFIIGVPLSLQEAKRLTSSLHAQMENPNKMQMYEEKPLFVKNISINVGENILQGFLYYDLKREQEEKTAFYTRLHETKQKLEGVLLRKWMTPRSVFEEITQDLQQYFSYSVENSRFIVEMKENAVSQRVNRMGLTLLAYNGSYSWDECLSFYRQKDVVEKNFQVLKNTIHQSPLNSQKQECVRGWIFILYLALMVRFKIQQQMRKTKLQEDYSFEALLLELEKIRKVELTNGEMMTTEITKRQRGILEKLELCA